MRSLLTNYEMRTVTSLDTALALLADTSAGWRPFAGGTDLMVLLEFGTLPKARFINIWPLGELRGIRAAGDRVVIGALSTYTDLLESVLVRDELPLVREAAGQTGAAAIQNRGTVGGNLANASPAADLPPALLVYDAVVTVASARGERTIPYAEFHSGYKIMDLAPDELIVSVSLASRRRHWKQTYRKVGTRRAQAISKVCFAGAADVADGLVRDVRFAFGSVAPTVVRAYAAEAAVRGQAPDEHTIRSVRAAISSDIAPIDDLRSTASYRRTVAANLVEDFLS